MKSRLTTALFLAIFIAFSSLFTVFAASVELTKIGTLDTSGQKYTEWWYTGTNPVLQGTTDASQDVTVTVGSDAETVVTADTNGNWAYTLTKPSGDYEIDLRDNDSSYVFTLHLGQSVPAAGTTTTTQTTSSETAAVPETGIEQTTALVFGIGISLLALYFYLYGEKERRHTFEKTISSDK